MKTEKVYFTILISFLLYSFILLGKTNKDKNVSYVKGEPHQTIFNINEWDNWIYWNGKSSVSPNGQSGGLYPGGLVGNIYQDGFVWGGCVHDSDPESPVIRVGGQTYFIGTVPGWIGSDPSDSRVKIYKIRKDYLTVSDQELSEEVAKVNSINVQDVTQTQIDQLRAEYAQNWADWPVAWGAPYMDINQNGVYDPPTDKPGIKHADMVLFFVVNDMDESTTHDMYGSPPIGIELQVTWWGYKQGGSLENTVFRRYRYINKSENNIDSMFVAMWSDPDLGNAGDDFVACDTIKNIGYCYNSSETDANFTQHGLAPSAFGYDFLQGPLVTGIDGQDLNKNGVNDIEDYGTWNLQKVGPGYINLPMTSFTYFASGSPYADPTNGDYENGTLKWYNLLNGRIPISDTTNVPFYLEGSGPQQGESTRFCLAGDPVNDPGGIYGDVDGQGNNFVPGDRRMIISSGPFDMIPGDTQEVIVAVVGGIGDSKTESITRMFESGINAQYLYNFLFDILPIEVNASVEYQNTNNTAVHFETETTNTTSIELSIFQYDETLITTLSLFDDGTHNDGAAGDGTWGNDWQTAPYSTGLYAEANVVYDDGSSYNWENIVQNITTSGPVDISQFNLISDNLNHDGLINPGENIQYTVGIQNQGVIAYTNVLIEKVTSNNPHVVIHEPPYGPMLVANLNGLESYNWSDPCYMFHVDENSPGSFTTELIFTITDVNHNKWMDTISIEVGNPLTFNPVDSLMIKVSGDYSGLFGYRIVYPEQLTSHDYQVTFNRHEWVFQYTLQDLTTGETILENQEYPDEYAHNSPIVDGFAITRGTTSFEPQMSWDWISNDDRWLTNASSSGELFNGGVFRGNSFLGSILSEWDMVSTKIVFNEEEITNCKVYRRDFGYPYPVQDGLGTFNGSAYDISDPDYPRRLNIIFVEDNNQKPADMIWNPDTSDRGAREYLLIMNSDYNEVTAGGYDDSNWGLSADVIWACWTRVEEGHTLLESSADLNLYYYILDNNDIYEFSPGNTIGINDENNKIITFSLKQNYPNPFNPATEIEFSLPVIENVKLEIYNTMGQKVRTLINQKISAGIHKVTWDAKNNTGDKVPTGIYFYRLSAGDYKKARKMLLIK